MCKCVHTYIHGTSNDYPAVLGMCVCTHFPVVVLQGVKVGQVRELYSRARVKTPMDWERCV